MFLLHLVAVVFLLPMLARTSPLRSDKEAEQRRVLLDFLQELDHQRKSALDVRSQTPPVLPVMYQSPYSAFASGGCTACSSNRPLPRPPTTKRPQLVHKPQLPEGMKIQVKEKNKMVLVTAPQPSKMGLEVHNSTAIVSQPMAHWFERSSLKTGEPGAGTVVQEEKVQEAEGQMIFIIDNERDVLYFKEEDNLSPHEKKMKLKQEHLESKGWLHDTFSRWRERNHDVQETSGAGPNDECVLLLLCLIGVNPNDFGRTGQDINNLLRGPQTDVLPMLSRYMTALRVGTQASTFNINNPCGRISSTCMTAVGPSLPFWPFVNNIVLGHF